MSFPPRTKEEALEIISRGEYRRYIGTIDINSLS